MKNKSANKHENRYEFRTIFHILDVMKNWKRLSSYAYQINERGINASRSVTGLKMIGITLWLQQLFLSVRLCRIKMQDYKVTLHFSYYIENSHP